MCKFGKVCIEQVLISEYVSGRLDNTCFQEVKTSKRGLKACWLKHVACFHNPFTVPKFVGLCERFSVLSNWDVLDNCFLD